MTRLLTRAVHGRSFNCVNHRDKNRFTEIVMSITEMLLEVRSLSGGDKLKFIQLLAQESAEIRARRSRIHRIKS